MSYLDEARQILCDEAKALEQAAANLDETFDRAVNLLLGIKGRIAVTGMGKSGHVARKIAATLSSTGSPAYFIHPCEASHGDMGMISEGDAVIAISNSGNTVELQDIILYARRNGMPIIAITKDKESFLGKHCSMVLLQPSLSEVCPLDCAPTTSTTVQMALGDAIAMCLLKVRGFTREDFQRYHPGGALGKKLLKAKDIMATGDALPIVRPETLIVNAIFVMTEKGFGCVGIINRHSELIGFLTDGDIRRHLNDNIMQTPVGHIMTKNPVIVTPDMLKDEVLALFHMKKISSAFVCEGKAIQGIISLHTIGV